MLISIDCGNTWVKIALHNSEGDVTELKRYSYSEAMQSELLNQQSNIPIISCNVKGKNPFTDWIQSNTCTQHINWQWKYPFVIDYLTPETLGTDRLAAMSGARALFPNQPLLVIDSGSCITYDYINGKNTYIGGAISAGIEMRLKAMHHYTGGLPDLPYPTEKEIVTIGKSTESCMYSSALMGTLFEIRGYIAALSEQTKTKVVLTGGDAENLAMKLECDTFVAPKLIHIGLHNIYQLNKGQFHD